MLAIVYLVIMVVWAVLMFLDSRTNRDYRSLGNGAIGWVLFAIVGYVLFYGKF